MRSDDAFKAGIIVGAFGACMWIGCVLLLSLVLMGAK